LSTLIRSSQNQNRHLPGLALGARAAYAETGSVAREEWRDEWDVIEAPRGLVVRQVPRSPCTPHEKVCRPAMRR
jgi:hypothetical protein